MSADHKHPSFLRHGVNNTLKILELLLIDPYKLVSSTKLHKY